MNYMYLKARAKINIFLDVLGKREDGYHELKTIMQTINLYDNIFVKKIPECELKLKCNLPWLPLDERNLIHKAASLLIKNYNIKDGIFIELTKNIPVAAGLAGGSADCAATLIGIRNIFNLNISNIELMKIGKTLGADVPYCIMRGTALAEGIGEKLKRISPFPNVYVLIVKPPINVSTASVFKKLDDKVVNTHPNIQNMIKNIEYNDINKISHKLYNVLETVTIEDYPIIAEIKNSMINYGAIGSLMSGSGPTVFGFYKSKKSCLHALDRKSVV